MEADLRDRSNPKFQGYGAVRLWKLDWESNRGDRAVYHATGKCDTRIVRVERYEEIYCVTKPVPSTRQPVSAIPGS